MAKKATVVVTLKKGKHKTQPWTFSIDDVGGAPNATVAERYTDSKSAKRGALRALGIWYGSVAIRHVVFRKGKAVDVIFKQG
jgi:hypothetical protein